MRRIVIKFGGTSVGTVQKIINAAKIVKRRHEEGNEIMVVVSAMSGTTNDLINRSKEISENFNKSELDVLMSSGEQVSSALLTGALIEQGIQARSWMGWQVPILTEGNHGSSRISQIYKKKINKFLNSGGIPIIAGFQGINLKNEFDVILCMEVVEHVSNIDLFIQRCSKLIKKNGIIFISTINKNLKSYAFAILGAEYILRWLPIGTHDWNKFL